jgi:hypothetical protein
MTHRSASNAIRSSVRSLLGLAIAIAVSLGAPPSHSSAQPAAALAIERTIPLQRVSGRIDHMAVDLGRKRLFVAELGNGTVDIIDLVAGKVIHRIEGLKEPQEVGYAPDADVLAVANAGDGSVRLFRGPELSLRALSILAMTPITSGLIRKRETLSLATAAAAWPSSIPSRLRLRAALRFRHTQRVSG